MGSKSACRLCATLYENKTLFHIFSKPGREKQLATTILRTFGIDVTERDVMPKVICRKCESFVNKMWNFRHNCQLSQLEIRQAISVKRMIKSPGTKPVKKQQTEESTDLKPQTSMFRRQLQFSKTPLVELPKTDVQPYRNIQPKPCTPSLSALSVIEVQSFQSVAKPHITTPTMTSREIEHMSVYDKKFDDVVTKSISTSQQNNLLRAVNTKQPHAVANVISEECPSIVLAVKIISLKSIENPCCGLLRRKENCSVLYGNTYDKLKDFAFENVWEEMKKISILLMF